MKWTEEQQRAIELRNKSILVAAAAGSGKTAVLVERIKRLILEENCRIDRMLIVTFTEKAASEMKEKIEKDIKSTIAKSQNPEEIKTLKRQLEIMPRANISTFHGFCSGILKRFFYLIKMEPNLKICDPTKQILLRRKAMDRLMEELFLEGNQEFYDFLDKFSGERNNEAFKEIINKVYSTLQSIDKPYVWLENAIDNIKNFKNENVNESAYRQVFYYSNILLTRVIYKGEMLLEYGKKVGMESALEPIGQRLKLGYIVKECLDNEDFDGAKSELSNMKIPTLLAKYFKEESNPNRTIAIEDFKKKIEEFNKDFKKVKERLSTSFFYETWEEITQDVSDSYDSGKFLLKCILRYEEIFSEEKAKKRLVDFDEIMHKACEILDNPEASKYYREKFDYIFIDEYQDSNIIQEALISKIARENNLFMVGDIKQSIYKFRLAEPEIFQGKYDNFKEKMELEGDTSLAEKIDLNKNFRSKRTVIDYINKIFKNIMPNYDDNAALYLGDPFGDKKLYSPILYLTDKAWDEDSEIDDEIAELKEKEKEALMMVKIIKENLNQPIFDSKAGIERPLKYKDIVILARSVKSYSDVLMNIFSKYDIPLFIDDTEGYFDTIEINTFLSLLNIIDNEKQDIHLLTVMRSFIFNFEVEELAKIRVHHKKGSYYNCINSYAVDGEEKELREKCENLLNKLKEWRENKKILPLEEFIWQLMLETEFYLLVGAMPNGNQRQANLRALIDMASTYSEGESVSLYGFIRYIDAVKEGKISLGQTKLITEKDDTVRVMTIHKSKGLEFPMVIVAGFNKNLKHNGGDGAITLDKDIGVSIPMVNFRENWSKPTILGNLIKIKKEMGEIAEEQRVLYVAMTRAKDILYMTATCKDLVDNVNDILNGGYKDTSFLTMTMPSLNRADVEIVDDISLSRVEKDRSEYNRELADFVNKENSSNSEEIKRIMEYSYPNKGEALIKSKYSVSELNLENNPKYVKKSIKLKEPESFITDKRLSKMEVGVVTHKVLELLDFNKARQDAGGEYINGLLDNMVKDYFITTEEKESISLKGILSFAKSDLGYRIGQAHINGSLHREQPFVIKKLKEGAEVMVQGIIDCFFMEGDNIILVDYKTTNMSKDSFENGGIEIIRESYRTQMEIYKEALELSYNKKVTESYLYLTNLAEAVRM